MAAETRFCDRCGTTIPSVQSRFCSSCGASIVTNSGALTDDRPSRFGTDVPVNQAPAQTTQEEQILRQFVHERMARSGLPWNLVSLVGNTAVLSRRKKVHHLTHFFLTLLTVPLLCFWLIVWIVMAVNRKEERRIVEIDLDEGKIVMKGTGLSGRLGITDDIWYLDFNGETVSFKTGDFWKDRFNL